MELLLISNKKMKILLTRQDMESYNLDADNLDYGVKNTRQTLDEIFELAKRKTGFEIKKGKLFVQAFPCVDGGCEIYLTRLDEEVSGLVEDGCTDSYVLSCYKNVEEAEKTAKAISINPNINEVKIYKDLYNQSYLVAVRLNKKVTEEARIYIKAFFYETDAGGVIIQKKAKFSKERYKLIE